MRKIILILLVVFSGSARAGLVTFNVHGSVDPSDRFGDGGNTFDLSYTFDMSEPNGGCAPAAVLGCYSALSLDSFMWGGNVYSGVGATGHVIYVTNAASGYSVNDSYEFRVDLAGVQHGWTNISLQLRLLDSTDAVFSDPSLPLTLDLDAFDQDYRFLYFDGTAVGEVGNLVSRAEVESIATVPLPGAIWLFGSALVLLRASSRNR